MAVIGEGYSGWFGFETRWRVPFVRTVVPRSFTIALTCTIPGPFQLDVTIVSPGKTTPENRPPSEGGIGMQRILVTRQPIEKRLLRRGLRFHNRVREPRRRGRTRRRASFAANPPFSTNEQRCPIRKERALFIVADGFDQYQCRPALVIDTDDAALAPHTGALPLRWRAMIMISSFELPGIS
jgi:hypothetical protein